MQANQLLSDRAGKDQEFLVWLLIVYYPPFWAECGCRDQDFCQIYLFPAILENGQVFIIGNLLAQMPRLIENCKMFPL